MYMMVVYMLQGVVNNQNDFYLNDMIESLIQNPAVNIAPNNAAVRANRII